MFGHVIVDDITPVAVAMLRVLDGRAICYSSMQDAMWDAQGHDEALNPAIASVNVVWDTTTVTKILGPMRVMGKH